MPVLEHFQQEYFYQDYPRMKYNKQGEYVIVESEEDEGKLEGEWFDSLSAMGLETCPAAKRSAPLALIIPGFVPPAPSPPPVEETSGGRY